jgi:type IV secretion system protein VirB4
MLKFTTYWPFVAGVPSSMEPFARAGKVDDIFRPRILGNGIFATATGCGVSFKLPGIDSEGLDRLTLDQISKQIAIANRCIPENCFVFEYLVTASAPRVPRREIKQPVVAQQAEERAKFLEETARFKGARLFVTLYIPGKVADDITTFSENSRAALRAIQDAAMIYEQHLRMAGISRLSADEMVQFYSYLLNLDRSLMTKTAAGVGRTPKKLGRVHIGMEDDYLRVGKQYCQMVSMAERPRRGTRPNLWASSLVSVDCDMVWCSIWQRKPGHTARSKAAAVENAVGMAGGDIFSATVGGYNPYVPPPRKATTVAQEKKVETIGDVLVDLDGAHYYGHYTLFGIIHSRDKVRVEDALPKIQGIFSDPAEASLLEETRGAVSAYVSCFPGQQYNVRQLWLRGDHKANLSFIYSPFQGRPWSEDLRDEYTMVYETRHGTPFYFSPFVNGNGNTTVLGAPGTGKSLNANAIITYAMKHGGKTFIFDQGGSYETNVRSLGGVVTRLGLERPRLNPFAGVGTKDNIHSVSQLVRMMLNKSGVAVGNADQDAIDKAVERLFDAPDSMRRLKHLHLPTNLASGLKRWVEGGIYGSIFDNVEDEL